MLNLADLHGFVTDTQRLRIANGRVKVICLQQDTISIGLVAHLEIDGVPGFTFRYSDMGALMRAGDRSAFAKYVCEPFRALDRVWEDGAQDGLRRERESEHRALHEQAEGAYARLRHKALAAGWNACAASLEGAV